MILALYKKVELEADCLSRRISISVSIGIGANLNFLFDLLQRNFLSYGFSGDVYMSPSLKIKKLTAMMHSLLLWFRSIR